MGVAPPSSERLAATHRRTQLGYPSFRRTLLIDTRRASPNGRYVMRANSSALTLRSVWQSSLTTLPCSRRSDPAPCSRLNSAIAQPSRDAPRNLAGNPRFSPSHYFLGVDYRCNDGVLKRIAYDITPYTTVIRLLGVVQNPANGFPARPLGVDGQHGARLHLAIRCTRDAALTICGTTLRPHFRPA